MKVHHTPSLSFQIFRCNLTQCYYVKLGIIKITMDFEKYKNQKEMETQKIKKTDLLYFYNNVCEDWKKVIVKHLVEQTGNEITVDNSLVFKAYNEADASLKKELKKYFTITDPGKWYEKYTTLNSVYEAMNLTENDVVPFKNPKTKRQKFLNGLAKTEIFVEFFNKGKQPDWNNSNEVKYNPRWILDGGGFSYYDCDIWHTHSDVGSLLVFLDYDVMNYVLRQQEFIDVYKEWVKPE
jgi:hypothetical protein